jgi:hypothetical protein
MKTMHHDTLKRVKEALNKTGYGFEGIFRAWFEGWNDIDSEVHTINFIDDEGNKSTGRVYIDKDGKGEF